MISDALLDVVRVLSLTTQEKIGRLPTMYPELQVSYLTSGSPASFGQWLLEEIERIDYSNRDQAASAKIRLQELPSWKLLRYVGVVSDDRWLLHYTDESTFYNIQHVGFTNGIVDADKLAFTVGSFADRGHGGYLFAYDTTQNDYTRHLERRDPLFGLCAVMFRATGVAVEYLGRERERFVIFQPVDARDFVFLDPVMQYGSYGVAAVAEHDEPSVFMSESLPDVVSWVKTHYMSVQQYLIAPSELIAASKR